MSAEVNDEQVIALRSEPADVAALVESASEQKQIHLPGEESGSKPNQKPAEPITSSAQSPASSEPEAASVAGSEESFPAQKPAAETPAKKTKGLVREIAELVCTTLFLLIVIRGVLAELRYIPSGSMEPTFLVNDRILVEKVSGWTMRPIERGDILVFYPPPIELGGKDVSMSPLNVMGRLTGLPLFPIDTAYIKRVIGVPGDQIRIKKGVGVFINDQLVPEPYVKEAPDYDVNVLGDIGGRNAVGELIKPFGDKTEPVIVPPDKLFMMGDNRNNSEDSHVWGFVDQKRVIGKSCLLFWRLLPGEPYKKDDERAIMSIQ